MNKSSKQRYIYVYADWVGLTQATLMGTLLVTPSRGKEIFSFEYDLDWLKNPNGQTTSRLIITHVGQAARMLGLEDDASCVMFNLAVSCQRAFSWHPERPKIVKNAILETHYKQLWMPAKSTLA